MTTWQNNHRPNIALQGTLRAPELSRYAAQYHPFYCIHHVETDYQIIDRLYTEQVENPLDFDQMENKALYWLGTEVIAIIDSYLTKGFLSEKRTHNLQAQHERIGAILPTLSGRERTYFERSHALSGLVLKALC